MPNRALLAVAAVAVSLVSVSAVEAQVDLTRFVAVGDSLTAGHTNVSLVETTQRTSVPALIHRQAAAPGPFRQPLFAPPGYSLEVVDGVPTGGLAIEFDQAGLPCNPFAIGLSSPVPGELLVDPPYDNLGAPGAKSVDVRNRTGERYFDVVLAGLGTQLEQALAREPTFVLLWIGANDALSAVGSGIVVDDVTLTTAETFATEFEAVVDALAATGAQMAIGNVPGVTSNPFATTIAPFVPDPSTCGPLLIDGQPVALLGPDGPLSPGDLVILPAASKIAAGIGIPLPFGTGEPLGDEDVVSVAERQQIETRIAEYNAIIADKADEVGAALVDINRLLAGLAENGIEFGGIEYSTDFLLGGIFSLDGFHPTAMGYAIVANEFIERINATYGSRLPLVDLYPFVFGGQSPAPLTGVESPALSVTPEAGGAIRAAVGVTEEVLAEAKRAKASLELLERRDLRRRGLQAEAGTLRASPKRGELSRDRPPSRRRGR
jgi:lysophospholipase L1-like esterase